MLLQIKFQTSIVQNILADLLWDFYSFHFHFSFLRESTPDKSWAEFQNLHPILWSIDKRLFGQFWPYGSCLAAAVGHLRRCKSTLLLAVKWSIDTLIFTFLYDIRFEMITFLYIFKRCAKKENIIRTSAHKIYLTITMLQILLLAMLFWSLHDDEADEL
jgi:hypothetical protein